MHALRWTLGGPYAGVICILFSLVLHLRGISPTCAAYQTCDSDTVSGRQTQISGGHIVCLMPFGCAHMESFKFPLPWRESVLKWVTSVFWFCVFLCPASHARSQSPCGVGSCFIYPCQGELLGYPQLPFFLNGMWDPEVVWAIYHFTPFSTEFPGPKSYRHPGPPPSLRWCGGAISCPKWI